MGTIQAPAVKPLKIGIVGAGAIVRQRHAPGLRALEGVTIAAVANSSPESAHKFCAEFAPLATVERHWEVLVAREDLDIVWIGTGPSLHEPVTVAALAAGRHVFCQARMATDLTASLRMLEAAAARPDLVTMLCPPPHGLRSDAFVKSLLAGGVVGSLRSITLRSLNGAFLDPSTPAHWRQRTEVSGKNIMTLGIHTEVLQRWFGPFDVRAASARICVPNRQGTKIEIPDRLVVLTDFDNGAQGLMEFSAVHPGPSVDSLEVVGSDGCLSLDFGSEQIQLLKPGQRAAQNLLVPESLDRPWQVEADFIAAVRKPEAPRPHPNFRDGVAYMGVVEHVWSLIAGDRE